MPRRRPGSRRRSQRRRPSRARRRRSRDGDTEGEPGRKPVLLAGGNPQIAKAYGDAPVQAYIAAMPGWKSDVGRRLDALIVRTVPGVYKAVKWNTPLYGFEGEGWFLGFHCLRSTSRWPSSVAPRCVRSSRRVQDEGRTLSRHPRERPARRSAACRLGEAGEPIARRAHVNGQMKKAAWKTPRGRIQ